MKQGDRVKLDRDYKVSISNIELKSETIGTIKSFITSHNVALIQYGYNEDKDQELMAGIPIDQLSKVTKEELKDINYKNLISKRWSLGNCVMHNDTEKVYLLKDVQLGLNESDDLYIAQAEDKTNLQLTRSYLEDNMILVESPIIAKLVNKETENLELENIDDMDGDVSSNFVKEEPEEYNLIELNIHGFKFIIEMTNEGNKIITSVEITENNINDYYDALYIIKRIIQWR